MLMQSGYAEPLGIAETGLLALVRNDNNTDNQILKSINSQA